MIKCSLKRISYSDQGIWGVFIAPNFDCCTIELPDRNNERGYSCIPRGLYRVVPRYSKKFGDIYHVKNVEGRTFIYIHSGNYAGDTKKGFKTHSLGCILPGLNYGTMENQRVVFNSRFALADLKEVLDYQLFSLEVL